MPSQLSGPLAEHLADRIPKAAKRAHARYRQVPAEDMEQAMWVWSLAHPDKLERLFREGRHGVIWSELRRAGSQAGREDERYRRAVKAAAAGFSLYDLEFYSTGVLARILPALVAADFDAPAALSNSMTSTDAAGIHIRSTDPFGGAENYLVILVDVAAACARLPEGQRRLLRTFYAVSQDDTQDGRWEREKLASSMGLTADALRMRVNRALRRLQDELGGVDPWV
jgi:hypothetical protein